MGHSFAFFLKQDVVMFAYVSSPLTFENSKLELLHSSTCYKSAFALLLYRPPRTTIC